MAGAGVVDEGVEGIGVPERGQGFAQARGEIGEGVDFGGIEMQGQGFAAVGLDFGDSGLGFLAR